MAAPGGGVNRPLLLLWNDGIELVVGVVLLIVETADVRRPIGGTSELVTEVRLPPAVDNNGGGVADREPLPAAPDGVVVVVVVMLLLLSGRGGEQLDDRRRLLLCWLLKPPVDADRC